MPNWISIACGLVCLLLVLFVGGMFLNVIANIQVTNNTTSVYPPPTQMIGIMPILFVVVVILGGVLIFLRVFFGPMLDGPMFDMYDGPREPVQSVRNGSCGMCNTDGELYTLYKGGMRTEVCASCLYR